MDDYDQYVLYGFDETITDGKVSKQKRISICGKNDQIFIRLHGCNTQNGEKPTSWNFYSGFSNETHFFLVERQVIIVSQESKTNHALTERKMKLEEFFYTGENSRGKTRTGM